MSRQRRWFRRALVAAVGFGIGVGAPRVRAAETFVALQYDVAASAQGCPTAADFRQSVARQLGYDPFRAAADKQVTVEMTRAAAGIEGRLRWSDADGRWSGDRRFSSRKPDCAALAASMTFSVAVQIQLLAALSPPAPPAARDGQTGDKGPAPPAAAGAQSRQGPPPGVASVPPDLTPSRAPAPAAERATPAVATPDPVIATPPAPAPAPSPLGGAVRTLAAGVGASFAGGVAPRPSALARLFVSGRRGPLSLELGADATLPVTQEQGDGTAFSLDTLAVETTGCGHLRLLAACVAARVGRIQARGSGVDVTRSPSGLFSQAGIRLAAAHALGARLFAAAHVDGLVMLSSWTVALNDTAVWTTPRFAVLLGFDLGVRFF